jgi:ABC-type multidrug transport system permease subunit
MWIKPEDDEYISLDNIAKYGGVFTLIIWLIVVSIIVYLTDTAVSALNLQTSDLGSTLIDGFKLFISSLIGYVFAEKHKS